MCQSHTGRLTGLWFLPKPAFGLNTTTTNNNNELQTPIIQPTNVQIILNVISMRIAGSYMFRHSICHLQRAYSVILLITYIITFCCLATSYLQRDCDGWLYVCMLSTDVCRPITFRIIFSVRVWHVPLVTSTQRIDSIFKLTSRAVDMDWSSANRRGRTRTQ